ncbi:MAG: carboxymuconolactone decarboxylase family protein [Pseudomonadota bacterium]
MTSSNAIKYETVIPEILQTPSGVHRVLDERGLDPKLRHLLRLRASQINRCGFCVKMHTTEVRHEGESNERLDRDVIWDDVRDFSEAEQAALEWTEALTRFEPKQDLGAIRAKLRAHYSDTEISLLTAEIGMINLWNRINISRH